MSDYYFYTEGLTVGYNGIPLIKNIEIGVNRGEILTLIGPNGAGKTTILKNVIGQLAPIAGLVYLDGKDRSLYKPNEAAKKLSVVLTARMQTEMMTCEEVVATGRYPYTGRFGVLSDYDREVVRKSMELVHISELKDRDYTQTSDGQKQRVLLARAICQEPEIIILDEPTSFLDIRYKLEFLSILQNMAREKNLSVIMSLHELDLAGRISDRIACVRGDKIDRIGSPSEIFSEGYIPLLYGMQVGSYEERTGNLELEKVEGEPEVFVICGGGTGTEVFRSLQRKKIPFACGILWENDLDYPSAKALASRLVSVEAFAEITDEKIKEAKEIMASCKEVICTLSTDKMTGFACKLKELI